MTLFMLKGHREQWAFLIGTVIGLGIASIYAMTLPGRLTAMVGPVHQSLVDRPSKKGKRPKFVLFGDSLTQRGYQVNERGWVAALSDAYTRRVDVVNRGYSGYNSRWCLLIMEQLFPLNEPEWEIPLLVIIFVGANDAALPQRSQHAPVQEYGDNVRKIISHFRRRGPATKILLLTPPPVDEEKWGAHCIHKGRPLDRYNSVTKMYVKSLQALGSELGVPVVDVWTLLGGDNTEISQHLIDGLHLSASGNSLLYQAVMKAITDSFPKLAPEALPFQAPEHFQLDATTTVIDV